MPGALVDSPASPETPVEADVCLVPKLVSIVVPVFNESSNIPTLVGRLEAISQSGSAAAFSWEFIFVNDGSCDESLAVLRDLASRCPRVRAVDLARNFGKEVALSAGLAAARGDAILCMDADLQHPPELIPEMLSAWRAGAEVVATIRRKIANQPVLRVLGSHVFYWIMNRFSEVEMISQTTDFRLIDRKVADAYLAIAERKRMFRGLIDWLGFRKTWIEFDAPERANGTPGYSYAKLLDLALNSFVSYSATPLRLIGLLGLLITTGSLALLLWMLAAPILVSKAFIYTPLAIVVVANTLLIGIVLSALGLMSLYISKIYAENLHRPLFVVRETVNLDGASHLQTAALPPKL